ncbi:hypothetical protein Asera_01180 [Actinocatenispora sera]|uniref:DNRLRE domain-containing protein n=2 Tax=Actinocatenispora sera TaxID=390989 RepID=A0A810KSI8_9ACTN|nr:hypothetical protein Asera_01180 [Actinocatenispora sera]
MRRLIGCLAVATIAGTGMSAAPATAGTYYRDLSQVSWSYTDSRAPAASHADPADPVPLGAWQDESGATHVSRVYASFDLSSLVGRHALGARLYAKESTATDCADRQIEVWRTADGPPHPTWQHPRHPLRQVGTIGATSRCPSPLAVDLTHAVTSALADGHTTLSLELREPADVEGQLAHGRQLDAGYGLKLDVSSNGTPSTPTELSNDSRPCASDTAYPYLPATDLRLAARFSDPDSSDRPTGEVEYWPVDHPDQRTVLTATSVSNGSIHGFTVTGTLNDGATYAWHARTRDDLDESSWSTTCYFVADAAGPANPPAVSSDNYSTTGPNTGGTPIDLTFDANGETDVAAFQYSWDTLSIPVTPVGQNWTDPFDGDQFVRADHLGGSATLQLVPPESGPVTLKVASYDRAYQRSTITTIRFVVGDTSPRVTTDQDPQYETPLTVHLAPGPHVDSVSSYEYQVDYGESVTVPAQPDGTATITITLTDPTSNWVYVRSHSPNGWVSSWYRWWIRLDTAPTVTSDTYPENTTGGGPGVPGDFTFSSGVSTVVSFRYSFDGAAGTVVDAADGGSATVSWTPTASGSHYVYVSPITSDGTQLSTTFYAFTVAAQ